MLNIAVSAARNAGNLIARAFERLDTVRISRKGHNDFVTEVDHAAEREIIRVINKAYPDHGFLAEESGISPGNEYQWIIDPLDGTTNFIHGVPHFATSIALLHNHKLEQAVVYDPIRQELFTATRGQGAQFNGRRIRVSTVTSLSEALLGTGFPFRDDQAAEQYLPIFAKFLTQTTGQRRAGAATLDLAYVAAGRLDGFWEFGLKPWDMAAGSLLIREAGGLVGDFDGSENHMQSGNILAANPKLFKAMLKIIAGTNNSSGNG
jgi:myo-inositol-1(or 4)-monophosphatase